MKPTNLSDEPLTLRKNRKLADVSPCLATEDSELLQGFSQVETVPDVQDFPLAGLSDFKQRLHDLRLSDRDFESWSVDLPFKEKLIWVLEDYNDIFPNMP